MTLDPEELRARLPRARTRREARRIEFERAAERYMKFVKRRQPRTLGRPKDLYDLERYQGAKAKSGRPGLWRGPAGYLLLLSVEKMQLKDRRRSLAQAIRVAIKTDPALKDFEAMHRLSDRALQARYEQAADFWADRVGQLLKRRMEGARYLWQCAVGAEKSILGVLEVVEAGTLCNRK
jgi:hypothetical protein